MAYQPIEVEANTPKTVRRFFETKLDRHFLMPARDLLKLPRRESCIQSKQSVTVGNILVDVISGMAALTYGADKRNTAKKFRQILERCYPWDQEPPDAIKGKRAAELIYASFRNPLAHALGIAENGEQIKILRKLPRGRGYREFDLVAMERSPTRKTNWAATVQAEPAVTTFLIEGLYWGVRMMIANSTRHPDLMATADKQLLNWPHW